MKAASETIEEYLRELVYKYHDWPAGDIRRNADEFTIFKNFFLKEGDRVPELSKQLRRNDREVVAMLYQLRFSNSSNRSTFNIDYLRWLRMFVSNFQKMLNYPYLPERDMNFRLIDDLMRYAKYPHNYKVVMTWSLHVPRLLLPPEIISGLIETVKRGNNMIASKMFQGIVETYLSCFPELREMDATPVNEISQNDEGSAAEPQHIEETNDVNSLISEIEILRKEVSDVRWLRETIEYQFEEFKKSTDEERRMMKENTRRSFFHELNSVENNNMLDVFSISKYNVDILRKAGWKSERPEITASLFFFDLLSEFFKKQGLKTMYSIGEAVEITMDNIDDFNYTGSEVTPETVIRADVKSPAWFYNGIRISKASVIECKKSEVDKT